MNNTYLDRSDTGVITLYIFAISALLYFSLPILNDESNIGSDDEINARTRPVGQVQIAKQVT